MDIVDRLRFDAARCEAQFSKGVATNIEEAMAEIERLRKQMDWQPIETAPKDEGQTVLLGFTKSSAEGRWHDGSKNHWKRAGWYFMDDDLLTARPCQPRCWAPMPIPPEKL